MRAGRAHRVRASVSKVCAYLMLEQLVHPRAQVALVMRASNLSGPSTDIMLVGVQPAHAQHGGQRANARYLTARARVRTWHLRLATMARERTFERWPVERVRQATVRWLCS